MVREGDEPQRTPSAELASSANHRDFRAREQPFHEGPAPSAAHLAGLAGVPRALPAPRYADFSGFSLTKEASAAESHVTAFPQCTPTMGQPCDSICGSPVIGRAGAPCSRTSLSSTPTEPPSQRYASAGATAVRWTTDESLALQDGRTSVCPTGLCKSATHDDFQTGVAHPHAGRIAEGGRRDVPRGGRACHGQSYCRAPASLPPHPTATDVLLETQANIAPGMPRLGQEPAEHQRECRKGGDRVKTCDATAQHAGGRQHAQDGLCSSLQRSRLTGRTGSLPSLSSMRRSMSTAVLFSSRRKTVGAGDGGTASHLTDPTTYSRLPPEVWLYGEAECHAETSLNFKGEEQGHKRATADAHRLHPGAHTKARAFTEGGIPVCRSRRSCSSAKKQLVFPLEQPDGHQQADYLRSCVPTLLELNNVPALFSLKQSLADADPLAHAFSQQTSPSVRCSYVFNAPAEDSSEEAAARASHTLVDDSRRGLREEENSEECSTTKRNANPEGNLSQKGPSCSGGTRAGSRLNIGLQAAHEARVLSEWWEGLMNVLDVTLFELCRQMKTFAPFHAKCLEVLHQLLVDYSDVHQQARAKQVAQLHTSLLDAHAEHAALRKEIVNLKHKTDKLQSTANEAVELRRMLDIHAQLFYLEEMDVLTAQQVKEDALRADFQWHKLLEVVEASQAGNESTSPADVWTSTGSEERQSTDDTGKANQLLTAVLPTAVTLLPHETIVKGTLESSMHVRLFQIRVPAGRWNLAIAVTCSQPLDISLLLLLASQQGIHEEREDHPDTSEDLILQKRTAAGGSFSLPGLPNFPSSLREEQRPRLVQPTSSQTPAYTDSGADSRETSCNPVKSADIADFTTEALQLGSFASFRIKPDEPQILQVKMPATGSPGGGWLFMRLQASGSAKSCAVYNAVEAGASSSVAAARSTAKRRTASESRSSKQSLRASLYASMVNGECDNQTLQLIGTAEKLEHPCFDADRSKCRDKLKGRQDSATGVLLGCEGNSDEKLENAPSLGHDSVQQGIASCLKEVRFSLTVHSVYLHKCTEKAGKDGPPVAANKGVEADKSRPHRSSFQSDASSATPNKTPIPLSVAAGSSMGARPDVVKPLCNRLRWQCGWPSRIVLKSEANTQTVNSKLLRGFVRRLHEGPRPPPVPQFCACPPGALYTDSPQLEKRCLDDAHSQTEPGNALEVLPGPQSGPPFASEGAGRVSDQQKDTECHSTQLAQAPEKKPVRAAEGAPQVAPRRCVFGGAAGECKYPYYYAPSYPILKLLLDETPVALGDFTSLLHQSHLLRDMAGAPTAFRGSMFARWPPRLLAETVWIILLQHTRARIRAGIKTPAEQQQQQPLPTGLHTNASPASSTRFSAVSSSGGGATASALTPDAEAASHENTASVPVIPCLSRCGGSSPDLAQAQTAPTSSAAVVDQGHCCADTSCSGSVDSLAAFTFKYFLSRLDVAVVAHSVFHSFLHSILYWAPVFEALAVQPQQSDGAAHLHTPVAAWGSITTEKRTDAPMSGDFPALGEDIETRMQAAETVTDKEVKHAHSRARNYIPWFAVRLFARITGLLASSGDTPLFRRSLNDFACLVVQALLDELTTVLPPENKEGRGPSKTAGADEVRARSLSCHAAPFRLASEGPGPRRRAPTVWQSPPRDGPQSHPFIPPTHLHVPSELCLAVTHRAAARIGLRIFSEEGTSEYRALVLEAVRLSKESALAAIRLPRRLSRWTHAEINRPWGAARPEAAVRRTSEGRGGYLYRSGDQENGSSAGEGVGGLYVTHAGDGQTSYGPPGKDRTLLFQRFFLSADASWDLPMPVDLLLQILTQQWEVLYVHLQQAMELVLDETDDKLLKPLTSLTGFSSFTRRLNPAGATAPGEALQLYYDALSATSSRLQPFCSSLPSAALSALLLHQSRLLEFPLPLPPSPFVTLAPPAEVTDTSAATRSKQTPARAHMKRKALPLWSVHAHWTLPPSGRTSHNASHVASESHTVRTSYVAPAADPSFQIISSASHEFRLAAFIVQGLTAFAGAAGDACDEAAPGHPRMWKDKALRAAIASQGRETETLGREVGAASPSKKWNQGRPVYRMSGCEPVTDAPAAAESATRAFLKDYVKGASSLQNVCGPAAVTSTCWRTEGEAGAGGAADVAEGPKTHQAVQPVQGSQEQAGVNSTSCKRPTGADSAVAIECGAQRRRGDQGLLVDAEQGAFSSGDASTRHAVAEETTAHRRLPGVSTQQGSTTGKTMVGVSASGTVDQAGVPAAAAGNHYASERKSSQCSHSKASRSTPSLDHTRQLPSISSMTYADIVLDRRAALETAKSIESSAEDEGVPAGAVLAQLRFFLDALLSVFGRTDLPDRATGEVSTELGEDSSGAGVQQEVARSLEDFTPWRGRLSPRIRAGEDEKQRLNNTDVASAQILLRSIWKTIFTVSARIAEEHEQRNTFQQLFALQRVRCRAAAKEALEELARLYRDQVDRLLILSLGSEDVSAVLRQPKVRDQLLRVHQSVADLGQQQLELQEAFLSAAGAAAAPDLQAPKEERSHELVRIRADRKLDAEVTGGEGGTKQSQVRGRESKWSS